ncbi:PadR family transcriptional regulator [Shimazuella kribbensis]|uniref:PadR family transcriptional regulator n=1 Tax=Shimazuella kribbensis TaxID=139808 RepID=UPI0004047E93|nr:PadR family transcriptional regulator [Shimazuella kribbensis]
MSAVRLLVLGTILRRKIAHGYRVYQDLTSWKVDTWTNVKPGSIYHALEKCESQEMIKAVSVSQTVKLGPSKTEYKITEKGKTEFISLLESALQNNDIQILAAGIAFMEFLPRHRVLDLLVEKLHSLHHTEQFLRSLPTELVPSVPSKHPELVGVWVGYFEYAITATKKLIESIEMGKYVFHDEKGEPGIDNSEDA